MRALFARHLVPVARQINALVGDRRRIDNRRARLHVTMKRCFNRRDRPASAPQLGQSGGTAKCANRQRACPNVQPQPARGLVAEGIDRLAMIGAVCKFTAAAVCAPCAGANGNRAGPDHDRRCEPAGADDQNAAGDDTANQRDLVDHLAEVLTKTVDRLRRVAVPERDSPVRSAGQMSAGWIGHRSRWKLVVLPPVIEAVVGASDIVDEAIAPIRAGDAKERQLNPARLRARIGDRQNRHLRVGACDGANLIGNGADRRSVFAAGMERELAAGDAGLSLRKACARRQCRRHAHCKADGVVQIRSAQALWRVATRGQQALGGCLRLRLDDRAIGPGIVRLPQRFGGDRRIHADGRERIHARRKRRLVGALRAQQLTSLPGFKNAAKPIGLRPLPGRIIGMPFARERMRHRRAQGRHGAVVGHRCSGECILHERAHRFRLRSLIERRQCALAHRRGHLSGKARRCIGRERAREAGRILRPQPVQHVPQRIEILGRAPRRTRYGRDGGDRIGRSRHSALPLLAGSRGGDSGIARKLDRLQRRALGDDGAQFRRVAQRPRKTGGAARPLAATRSPAIEHPVRQQALLLLVKRSELGLAAQRTDELLGRRRLTDPEETTAGVRLPFDPVRNLLPALRRDVLRRRCDISGIVVGAPDRRIARVGRRPRLFRGRPRRVDGVLERRVRPFRSLFAPGRVAPIGCDGAGSWRHIASVCLRSVDQFTPRRGLPIHTQGSATEAVARKLASKADAKLTPRGRTNYRTFGVPSVFESARLLRAARSSGATARARL